MRMTHKRVLVVDDTEAWRDEVRKVVAGLGHEVIEAADAEEAERLLNEQPLDLLITDNWMEGQDAGLDLLGRIKDRGLPSILHTSYLSRVQKTRLEQTLPKVVPVLKSSDHTELAAAIEKLL